MPVVAPVPNQDSTTRRFSESVLACDSAPVASTRRTPSRRSVLRATPVALAPWPIHSPFCCTGSSCWVRRVRREKPGVLAPVTFWVVTSMPALATPSPRAPVLRASSRPT